MWKTKTTAQSTSDLSLKRQTSEISLKTSEVATLVATLANCSAILLIACPEYHVTFETETLSAALTSRKHSVLP